MFSYLLYLQQMLYSTTSKCVFQKIFVRFQQRSIAIEDYMSTKFPSILSKRYFESKIKSLKLRKTEAYKSIGRYLKEIESKYTLFKKTPLAENHHSCLHTRTEERITFIRSFIKKFSDSRRFARIFNSLEFTAMMVWIWKKFSNGWEKLNFSCYFKAVKKTKKQKITFSAGR